MKKFRLNYFQAGVRARRDGRDITDNEYTPGNHPWREWCSGWTSEDTAIRHPELAKFIQGPHAEGYQP